VLEDNCFALKVHEGIKSQCESQGISTIRLSDVKAWSQLIHEIRSQCRLLRKSVCPIELYAIMCIFFLLLAFVFVTQEIFERNLVNLLNMVMMGMYILMQVIKTIFKIALAESISSEVFVFCQSNFKTE